MTDKIVNSLWWLAVMSMLCIAAGVALFVGYRGMFDLIAGRWTAGVVAMIVSAGACAGAMLLGKHRNDLW